MGLGSGLSEHTTRGRRGPGASRGSGGRGGGRAGRAGRCRGPPGEKAPSPAPTSSPHLHVGHEALLDSPAVFIDLIQKLQLIIIAATHGGGNGGEKSRLRFEEQLPRCPTA